MPLYDRVCESCGWQAVDVWESVNAPISLCPDCGAYAKRAWLTKSAAIIGDECDFIQHNGTKEPIHFTKRSVFRRWLKEKGFEVKHSHVPPPGSDKSKFTSNWAASYDPYTANNVKILMERAMLNAKPEAPEPSVNLTFSAGTLSTKDARARRKLHRRQQERAQYAKPTKPLRTHEDLVRFFKESEGG